MSWYVGQQVYCLRYGVGKILGIDNTMLYAIKVEFYDEKATHTYTLGGKFYACDANPLLYPAKPEIVLPKWRPKPGEWCWFWAEPCTITFLAQFTEQDNFQTKGGTTWENCAPFVGELPEHLKEVNS
jgi:hypothetical protein